MKAFRRWRERRDRLADIAVLSCLMFGDEYVLQLMDRTGLGAGRIYPALMRLEWAGLVVSAWDQPEPGGLPRRRHYWPTADAVPLFHQHEQVKR